MRDGALRCSPGLVYRFGGSRSRKGHSFALYACERRVGVLHNLNLGARRDCLRGDFCIPLVIRAGVFFHGNVKIGAAEPERRDIGAAYAFLFPLLRQGYHAEQFQVYARIGFDIIYGGRKGFVIDRERRFGYAHRPGGGLGVAYLRLY